MFLPVASTADAGVNYLVYLATRMWHFLLLGHLFLPIYLQTADDVCISEGPSALGDHKVGSTLVWCGRSAEPQQQSGSEALQQRGGFTQNFNEFSEGSRSREMGAGSVDI